MRRQSAFFGIARQIVVWFVTIMVFWFTLSLFMPPSQAQQPETMEWRVKRLENRTMRLLKRVQVLENANKG